MDQPPEEYTQNELDNNDNPIDRKTILEKLDTSSKVMIDSVSFIIFFIMMELNRLFKKRFII